jgi:hypothetical protein
MQAALFGSGDKLKTLALEAISDAAQDMPALVSMGGAGSAGNVDGISPYGLGELERLWKL